MVAEEEDFERYLMNHPEFVEIAENAKYAGLLALLKGKGKYIHEIIAEYPAMTETEIHDALEKLEKLDLIKKLELAQGFLYYQTKTGQEFSEYYQKARGYFSLG